MVGHHHEVVVVGGGGVGAAAAWSLARAGRDVLLLESRTRAHHLGASHGDTRNFNPGYYRPEYLQLLKSALPLWRELEAQSTSPLLDSVGVVSHGPRQDYDQLLGALPSIGFRAELLAAEAANERWPQLRFNGPAIFLADGGRLYAERAVHALYQAAAHHGAQIRENTPARGITAAEDSVRVDTDFGPVTARTAIVAAGAWTENLLGHVIPLPALRVTQEQPAHFAVASGTLGQFADLPGFNHHPEPSPGDREWDSWWPSGIYGGFTPGVGIKAGWHGVGPVTDPDNRSLTSDPKLLAALVRYVEEWIPGADPTAITEFSCTYTSTASGDFAIDRAGSIIVATGFSGHAFKFLPALGALLARLATDPSARSPFPIHF